MAATAACRRVVILKGIANVPLLLGRGRRLQVGTGRLNVCAFLRGEDIVLPLDKKQEQDKPFPRQRRERPAMAGQGRIIPDLRPDKMGSKKIRQFFRMQAINARVERHFRKKDK